MRVLLKLAAGAPLYRSGDGSVHVRVPVGGRQEVYRTRSGAFRDWLIEGYFGRAERPPSPGRLRGS